MAITVANALTAGDAASVQFALRLMQMLSQFSQVPFYTKIPILNRLRAQGENPAHLALAAQSMRISLGVFVVFAITIDLTIGPILDLVDSQTAFPSQSFWLILVLAGLMERIGAMHVQLLMTSNRMIAHVANLVTAIIWIGSVLVLWSGVGSLALPLGMLLAYAGFYAPWSSYQSGAAMGQAGGLRFELRTSVVPFLVLAAYSASARLVG
jgi:hypothetical protein